MAVSKGWELAIRRVRGKKGGCQSGQRRLKGYDPAGGRAYKKIIGGRRRLT